MTIEIPGENEVRLRDFASPDLRVEGVETGLAFGPIEMFAASLGLCTASVLIGYGETLEVPSDRLEIHLRWSVPQHPNRVDDIHMEIRWPGLPDSHRAAARRAAAQCTIHHTLERPTQIETVVLPP